MTNEQLENGQYLKKKISEAKKNLSVLKEANELMMASENRPAGEMNRFRMFIDSVPASTHLNSMGLCEAVGDEIYRAQALLALSAFIKELETRIEYLEMKFSEL